MSLPPIVCQNCGAKYKLPESFTSDKAKCKACGAVIDVAAQRAETTKQRSATASARPAAARPASARPATPLAAPAHPKTESPKPTRSARGRPRPGAAAAEATAPAARRGRRGARTEDGDEGEGTGRRGRSRREPAGRGGNKGVMIGSAIGLVAIVIVGIVILMKQGGGDQPAKTDTANSEAAKPDAANPDAGKTDAAKTDAGDTGEHAADATDQPSATTPSESAPESTDTKAAEASAKTAETAPPKDQTPPADGAKITSKDQLFDPKTETQPLEYPPEVTAEQRAHIEQLVQTAMDGSGASPRAMNELADIGYYGLYGLVNGLRQIDYTDSFQSMTAFAINKKLEEMTYGLAVDYRPPQVGEDQPLDDVNYDAKTVGVWIDTIRNKLPTKEAFDKWIETRKKMRAKDK